MRIFEYINNNLGTRYDSDEDIEWLNIIKHYTLSEDFIEHMKDYIDWYYISTYQVLSEPFIEKYKDKVNWDTVSMYQKLSESFIEKFQDKVDWYAISAYQKLSENFIEKFQDKVSWTHISAYQKLSESFIEKYKDKVNWRNISIYQKLSENFISKYQDRVDWEYISKYKKLSEPFIDRYVFPVPKTMLWQYQSTKFKKQKLIDTGKYECYDNYFIAYKAIKSDRYSLFNFQYQYLSGETYESSCDCTSNENSFGLNVGTYEHAKGYLDNWQGFIVKCKINYEDIGRIVHNGEKVRCFKLTILE